MGERSKLGALEVTTKTYMQVLCVLFSKKIDGVILCYLWYIREEAVYRCKKMVSDDNYEFAAKLTFKSKISYQKLTLQS